MSDICPQAFCGGIGNNLSGHLQTGEKFGMVKGGRLALEKVIGELSIEGEESPGKGNRQKAERHRSGLGTSSNQGRRTGWRSVSELPNRVAEPSDRTEAVVSERINGSRNALNGL